MLDPYIQFIHSVYVLKHELEGKNTVIMLHTIKLFVLQSLPSPFLQFMLVALSKFCHSVHASDTVQFRGEELICLSFLASGTIKFSCDSVYAMS